MRLLRQPKKNVVKFAFSIPSCQIHVVPLESSVILDNIVSLLIGIKLLFC